LSCSNHLSSGSMKHKKMLVVVGSFREAGRSNFSRARCSYADLVAGVEARGTVVAARALAAAAAAGVGRREETCVGVALPS